jgi:hypothetical protein
MALCRSSMGFDWEISVDPVTGTCIGGETNTVEVP